ncbi:MAG: hypothetical protein Q4F31_09430 [Eubacteriales bacterium]|nr:hypothetical protein [Eubacteriales bacterium]
MDNQKVYFCYCCGKLIDTDHCFSVRVGSRTLISCPKCRGSYPYVPYISYNALAGLPDLRIRR